MSSCTSSMPRYRTSLTTPTIVRHCDFWPGVNALKNTRLLSGSCPGQSCRAVDLADDGDARRCRTCPRREQAAATKRQLHRGEETWRRDLIIQRRIPARRLRRLRLAFEHDTHALADRSERKRPRNTAPAASTPGRCRDAVQHLVHELIRRRLRHLLFDPQRKHVRGIESEIDRPQVRKAPDDKSGRDEHHHRQRHLRRRAVPTASGSSGRPAVVRGRRH